MHFTKPTVFGLIQSATVFAATHQVIVGQNNGLTFTPNTVTAAAGDTVQFMFSTQNHTVTAGNPNAGCSPSGQFYSGFVPAPGAASPAKPAASAAAKAGHKMIRGENNIFLPRAGALPSFTVPVQNTQPIAVYCSQAQHCQAGMVMIINPTQTGATSLQAYQALSAKAKTNVIPKTGVTGGTLANLVKPATPAGAAGASGAAKGTTGATGAAGTTAAKGKKAKKAKKAGAAKRATEAGQAAAAN